MKGRGIAIALLCILPIEQGHTENTSTTGKERGISVIGECLTKVAHDRGAVTVGSSTLAKTSKEASEQAIRSHELIKADVIKLGLKDAAIETANYSVYQECSYHESKRVCQGYRGHISTRFETSEISRVSDVIAIATRHGSEEVSNLQTFASPEQVRSARESCLEVATRNAAAKAHKIAIGAGVTLGKVVSITEAAEMEDPLVPQIRMRQFEAATMSDPTANTPSIDSKPLDLRVRITATYSID